MTAETTSNREQLFDVHAIATRWSASADHLLDLYLTTVGRLADAHVKRAHALEHPAVIAIAEIQASMSRDVADAYVKSARKLLDH